MDSIREQCESSFEAFRQAIEGVTAEEAEAFREAHWPTHPWHVGEDGSLSGLVWHVAAWKAVYLHGLRSGSFADKAAVRPDEDTWEGRKDWLFRVHAGIIECLRRLEVERATTLTIDGEEKMIEDVLCPDFTEHDRYHAAQAWYIRQRYRAVHGE